MRRDRALSSALIRPICKVPPPPLPPPKRRLFPPAGDMRSHSIRSSWRRASRERWSSSILDRIRHQRSYLGMAALRIADAPETSGSSATNSFSDPVRCVSYFTHLVWSSPYRSVRSRAPDDQDQAAEVLEVRPTLCWRGESAANSSRKKKIASGAK
jgi:hypothetical protein